MLTRGALVVIACVLLVASVAGGQGSQTTVAEAGGYRLTARTEGKDVCITLRGKGAGSETCERLGLYTDVVQVVADGRRQTTLAAGVPGDVAAVSLDDQRYETVAAEGFDARFVLVPAAPRSRIIRLYDAEGTLVGAERSDNDPPQTHRHAVFKAVGTRFVVSRDFELRADPAELDRVVATTCRVVRSQHSSVEDCTADDQVDIYPLEVGAACAPALPLLHGLVSAEVSGVDVVLGTGKHLRVRTGALPAAYHGLRTVAVSIARGTAVRSVALLGAAGKTIRRQPIGAAPSGFPCRDDEGLGVSFATLTFAGPSGSDAAPITVAEAGGHAFVIADDGERGLCAGVDRFRNGCVIPPIRTNDVFLDRRGNLVSGVTPSDAASIEFVFDDGTRQTAPTTDGAAYTGRYAGKVRFLLAEVPAARRVTRAFVLDENGARLAPTYVFRNEPNRRTGRLRGTPLQTFDVSSGLDARTDVPHCLRRPGESQVFSVCRDGRRFNAVLRVTCSPRRTLAFGYLGRGMSGVTGELAGGRTVDARVVRPATGQGGGRVWVLKLPAGAALHAVRLRGPIPRFTTRHSVLRLPPAERQCGYSVTGIGA